MDARLWLLGLTAVGMTLSGCAGESANVGDNAPTDRTDEIVRETVTVAPPAVTVTAKPEIETSAPTSEEPEPPRPTDGDDKTEAGSESTTIDLPQPERPLGLDDFFNPGNWDEGRWNVANRTNEKGVAVDAFLEEELELRLQNQFTSLRFDAGQSNDSRSSDCVTKIDIVVDGELCETREFGFNVIQEFEAIDVADSNAVKFQVDNDGCYALVVLSRIQVE